MGWNNLFNFSFEVTARCNLNCRFCYNVWKHDPHYPKGELNLEQIRSLFNKVLFGLPTETIHLTGGEPLVREDLEEIVHYFTQKRIYVAISTNGTLLTEKRLESLVQAGAKRFELTLLGPNSEVHGRACGDPENFNHICRAITAVRERNLFLRAAMTVTAENIDHAPQTALKAIELGAHEFILYRFVPTDGKINGQSALLPSRQQINSAVSKLDELASKLKTPIKIGIPIAPCELDQLPRHIPLTMCMGGISKFIIDPVGNLRLCEQSSQRHGDLRTENFFFKPFSKPTRDFIRQIPTRCSSCREIKKCRGGCRMLTPSI